MEHGCGGRYRSYPVNSAHAHVKELHEKLANLTGDHSYLTAQWAKENREVAEKAVAPLPASHRRLDVVEGTGNGAPHSVCARTVCMALTVGSVQITYIKPEFQHCPSSV